MQNQFTPWTHNICLSIIPADKQATLLNLRSKRSDLIWWIMSGIEPSVQTAFRFKPDTLPKWPVILVLQAGLEPARHKDTTF